MCKVAVPGATLEQITEIATLCWKELEKDISVPDVLLLRNKMKEALIEKLGPHVPQPKAGNTKKPRGAAAGQVAAAQAAAGQATADEIQEIS
jgi:hypothetical protein